MKIQVISTGHADDAYRHRLVVPDLPLPEDLRPFLEQIYRTGFYSNFGPMTRALEARLLAMFGLADEACVTCSSATAGLSAALLATGRVGPVLLPSFTFPASLGAIRAAGLLPLVADVDPKTWALEGDVLDEALARTGARLVMLVAPFGIARDWDNAITICRRHDAAIVIDNASGLGGPRSRRTSAPDVFEVVSMHATKPFAIGEGGAIFAHSVHEPRLRSALNFALPSSDPDAGLAWGFNGKMSEFHGAVGIAQAERFMEHVARRQAFAATYVEALRAYPDLAFWRDIAASPWQSFPVLLPSRHAAERFVAECAALGVEIRRYYRPSLSRWADVACVGPCPVAEDLADRMCVLPVRALTAEAETHEIVDLVFEALKRSLAGSQVHHLSR